MASDRDFLLRFWQDGGAFVPLDLPVYRYRYHAGSLTVTDQRSLGALSMLDENLRLARRLSTGAGDERLRSAARAWVRATALEKVIVFARNGRVAQAGAAAARQLAEDPAWVFHVAGVLPGKVFSSCRRRIRERHP
jgi:hypothetical protein